MHGPRDMMRKAKLIDDQTFRHLHLLYILNRIIDVLSKVGICLLSRRRFPINVSKTSTAQNQASRMTRWAMSWKSFYEVHSYEAAVLQKISEASVLSQMIETQWWKVCCEGCPIEYQISQNLGTARTALSAMFGPNISDVFAFSLH